MKKWIPVLATSIGLTVGACALSPGARDSDDDLDYSYGYYDYYDVGYLDDGKNEDDWFYDYYEYDTLDYDYWDWDDSWYDWDENGEF